MPELPDVEVYAAAIKHRVVGKPLLAMRALTPFVLRSVEPPLKAYVGQTVTDVWRHGKRIVIAFENGAIQAIHLMISGRFLWIDPTKRTSNPKGKANLAFWDFDNGQLLLTEVSTHKRAMIHTFQRPEDLETLGSVGLEPLTCSAEAFAAVLRQENRTLKRALTRPAWFSGIGNAYSDEILHAARLSPMRLTQALSDEEVERLWDATRTTLSRWAEILKAEFGDRFPGKGQVTAFRPDFAAHGKFGKPCPDCGMPIQRIVYAENEANYCARCQNEDRILADRSLSRLLKDDWPRTLAELVGD